jgi:hypothetical protein
MALKSKSLDKVRADLPLSSVIEPEQLVRVNLNVPLSIRTRWKHAAATENKPMQDLIIRAMEQMLNKNL